MKNTILYSLVAASLILGGANAFAGDHMGKHSASSHSASQNSNNKPISKVSSVQNMPDESMVYIQGYLTQNLGDEMYVFQDDTGTMNIEIDDDLMAGNMTTPTTVVWIAAEVNKEGNIVSLEAEEVQFMPETNSASNVSNN